MSQLDIFRSLHQELYHLFRWHDDQELYNIAEKWTRPPLVGGYLVGDCDDWVVEMDYRCREHGIYDGIHYACCKINSGPNLYDHLALIFDNGGTLWASECNSSDIVPARNLPYTNWYWSPTKSIVSTWVEMPR